MDQVFGHLLYEEEYAWPIRMDAYYLLASS